MWHLLPLQNEIKGNSGLRPLIQAAFAPFPTPPPSNSGAQRHELPAGPVPLSWSPDELAAPGPNSVDWRSIMVRGGSGIRRFKRLARMVTKGRCVMIWTAASRIQPYAAGPSIASPRTRSQA